jgi:glycosyltransferase involved in cell wall biosynthesis
MDKIAVVMTYFDRPAQLAKTLGTIFQSKHTNYSIVVVDDASTLQPWISEKPGLVEIIRIPPQEKTWRGAVVPFNIGIRRALEDKPDIIVMQNAECYHVGDVLMYASEHVSDTQCVSFACWNEAKHCPDLWKAIKANNNRPPGAGSGWYNHPFNPRMLHFCNAYSRKTMIALNGLDERFAGGLGFDDNDLVRRTEQLGTQTRITDETMPFVVHQQHERKGQTEELYQVNRALWYGIRTKELCNFRARHTITEDFT